MDKLQKAKPTISVTMPVYNCCQTVEKAVRSVLEQTWNDFEIVIVDDGSTDDTPLILSKLAATDSRIRIISLEKNVGVGAARNIALENCYGEWITVLDADDWYLPTRLEELITNAKKLEADLIIDNLRLYDHALQRIVGRTNYAGKRSVAPLTAEALFEGDTAYTRHPLGFCKPMLKREFLQRQRVTYNSLYRVGEDFLFLAEVLLNGARAFLIPTANYVYIHRISISNRTVSPTSRAGTGFIDILRTCRYLANRYGSDMNQREQRALARKRQTISDWLLYMKLLTAIRAGNKQEAIKIIKRRPRLALVKAYTVWNRLQDLAMVRLSSRIRAAD